MTFKTSQKNTKGANPQKKKKRKQKKKKTHTHKQTHTSKIYYKHNNGAEVILLERERPTSAEKRSYRE